jgi:hypothetical protein
VVKVVRVASPAAVAMLRQATAIAPRRNKASDGLLPSAEHIKQSPDSDHNLGLAVDLTHDPKHKMDCAVIYRKLKKDPRVSYLIYNKKIWSRARAKEGDRVYRGLNPHTKHIHVSIEPSEAKNTSPWFPWMDKPKTHNVLAARIRRAKKKRPHTPDEPKGK